MALLLSPHMMDSSFTDTFQVIPLLPSMVESRVQVPPEQVQILTSILVAAHGGALVAISRKFLSVSASGVVD